MTKWADWFTKQLQERFPDLRAGKCNCRKISGTNTWSQHAWCNALDIYHKDWGYSTNPIHQAWLDEVYAFIMTHFDDMSIRTIIWRKKNHFHHIHIDPWPKGYGTPSCAGGTMRYQWPNGDVKSTTKYGSFDPINGYVDLPDKPIEEIDFMNQVIQKGAQGYEVAVIQRDLHDLGYDLGNWPAYDGERPEWDDGRPFPVGADGQFGDATKAPIELFQEASSLIVNGVIDGVTLGFLRDAVGATAGVPVLVPHTHEVPKTGKADPT